MVVRPLNINVNSNNSNIYINSTIKTRSEPFRIGKMLLEIVRSLVLFGGGLLLSPFK